MAYAARTEVAFEKSIAEIVALVRGAGAAQIGQFDDVGFYAIQFMLADRLIRFRLPLPSIDEMPTRKGNNQLLTAQQRRERLDQARRQRGRALLLVIKAKLESVESKIETIEQAFLAHVVMADGRTVHERISEPIALEYQTGRPDPGRGLLPPPSTKDKP